MENLSVLVTGVSAVSLRQNDLMLRQLEIILEDCDKACESPVYKVLDLKVAAVSDMLQRGIHWNCDGGKK